MGECVQGSLISPIKKEAACIIMWHELNSSRHLGVRYVYYMSMGVQKLMSKVEQRKPEGQTLFHLGYPNNHCYTITISTSSIQVQRFGW